MGQAGDGVNWLELVEISWNWSELVELV